MTALYFSNVHGAISMIYTSYSKTYPKRQNSPENMILKNYHPSTSSLKTKTTKLSQTFTTNPQTLISRDITLKLHKINPFIPVM